MWYEEDRIWELEDEVKRLRKDKERLDWLEKALADEVWPEYAIEHDSGKPTALVMVRGYEPEYFSCDSTLRGCIDEAMDRFSE